MNELLVFTDELFKDVRVIFNQNDDEFMFCLKDVCDNLGLQNSSKAKKSIIDEFEEDLTIRYPLITNGGKQYLDFIKEEHAYYLIGKSRKKGAKKFRQWIYKNVLISIRKHNAYIINQETKSAEQLAIDITKAYTSIIQEKSNMLIKQEETLKLLQDTIDEQKQQLLLEQEKYNNLSIAFQNYTSIQEDRFRSKMQRKKFVENVNKFGKKHNIHFQDIYNTVYLYLRRAHNIKDKITIDLVFSKKEYAQDAFVILERLSKDPYIIYKHLINY